MGHCASSISSSSHDFFIGSMTQEIGHGKPTPDFTASSCTPRSRPDLMWTHKNMEKMHTSTTMQANTHTHTQNQQPKQTTKQNTPKKEQAKQKQIKKVKQPHSKQITYFTQVFAFVSGRNFVQLFMHQGTWSDQIRRSQRPCANASQMCSHCQ